MPARSSMVADMTSGMAASLRRLRTTQEPFVPAPTSPSSSSSWASLPSDTHVPSSPLVAASGYSRHYSFSHNPYALDLGLCFSCFNASRGCTPTGRRGSSPSDDHLMVSNSEAPEKGGARSSCPHPRPWKRLRAKRGFTYFFCLQCHQTWRVPTCGDTISIGTK